MIASPSIIGLPSTFTSWRHDQPATILQLSDCPSRFIGMVQPTGSGKSVTYMAHLLLEGKRGCILTSTKSLQDQLVREFHSLGLHDMRGQSNYQCGIEAVSVDDGPCHAGYRCDLRDAGCPYYDALRVAQHAQLLVTNYSFWLSQQAYGQGLGKFDILVCDEAHAAVDELAEFLSVQITDKEADQFLHSKPPATSWWKWAGDHAYSLSSEMEILKADLGDRAGQRRVIQGKRLLTKLERLSHGEGWIREQTPKGTRYDPIWPGPFAEKLLFRGTDKVVLVSATTRERTLDLLGIPKSDRSFLESGGGFPVDRRPVYFLPTARLTHKSTDEELIFWLYTIDRIIRDRQDRKGIIHTVSYKRAHLIRQNSKFSHLMQVHDPGTGAVAIERFRASRPGTVLVSPAMTTGVNFPYDDCEYQIIAKLPFPDSRSAILKARAEGDPNYYAYLTMMEIVQATGRGMRAKDDRCETFLLDGHWQWFGPKFKGYAPDWFLKAIKTVGQVPTPLPKINTR